ncbi:glycosyltransferase family 9 protein [Sporolituus thermophilus]|uniref:Heptosyltransferase-1 n=1 Tax=Sporolituus thermophilus DSM 23256 TaxID=1123285 RepID=A0A1G7NH40_9FIRM|nr:glycosyltransferase family 9 protein [Sporolituus thermophilus]SDF72570.1 heptosyltransferase-1 [Sporolituus thermophilus DSM 23256]
MNNILIYRLNYLGDVIMATPIVRAVRQRYPNAKVTFATAAHLEPLLKFNPHLNDIVTTDVRGLKTLKGRLAWAAVLKRGGYDCCINLTRSFSSAFYAWLADIPVRVGFNTEGRSFLLTKSISYNKHDFEIDCFADVAALVDVPVSDKTPEVLFDSQAQEKAAALLPYGKICAVHAGYTHPAKTWPARNVAAVIDAIWALDHIPVLIGGKNELAFANEIITHCRRPPVNIVGQTSLLELAAVLQQSKLYIGVDSGPAHLAKAVGTKGIVLFGPTSPVKWGYRDNINLTGGADCSPCYPRTCRDPWCIKKIAAQTVIERLLQV